MAYPGDDCGPPLGALTALDGWILKDISTGDGAETRRYVYVCNGTVTSIECTYPPPALPPPPSPPVSPPPPPPPPPPP